MAGVTTVLEIVLVVIVVAVLVWSAGGRDLRRLERDAQEREFEELRDRMADRKARYLRIDEDEEAS